MAVRSGIGRSITVGVLLLAVVGIIITLMNFTNSGKERVSPGQAAPDFTLVDLNGNKLSLNDLRGKTVLLNFWGSWCEPCRKEMPALQAAYDEFKERGFVVLGVNIGESRVTAKGFADRYGVAFPVVLDTDRNVTLNLYKVGPIPTSFFIDQNGVVRQVVEGQMSEEFIFQKVQALLGQP